MPDVLTPLPAGLESQHAASLLVQLRQWMREAKSLLVCFSGGVDSALVLMVASQELGERAVGMTAVSPSLPAEERVQAELLARRVGARHQFVDSQELLRPGYVANGPDRCFHCKSELYEIAERQRQQWGLEHVANGTNRDDLGDYRPGLEAAKAKSVRSPLLELDFGKADVRAVAQLLGLQVWNKPAAACLSSRLPYGTAVTPERLRQIEALELHLKQQGLRQVRVRWHEAIARIEVDLAELPQLLDPELRASIVDVGRQLGFTYVTLDLGGYRVGSHNEALGARRALPLVPGPA